MIVDNCSQCETCQCNFCINYGVEKCSEVCLECYKTPPEAENYIHVERLDIRCPNFKNL